MANEHILLILSDLEMTRRLRDDVLVPAGFRVTDVDEWKAASYILQQKDSPDLVIVSETLENRRSIDQARTLIERFPFIPVLLLSEKASDQGAVQAIRDGFFDCLQPATELRDDAADDYPGAGSPPSLA